MRRAEGIAAKRANLRQLAIACAMPVLSCSRSSESHREATAGAGQSPAAAATVDGGANVAVDASRGDTTPSSADPVLSRVYEWNRALDHHDLAALEALYGQEVCFYGQKSTRSKVLAAKDHALSADPSFHQEIVGDVTVTPSGYSAVATFVKRSGSGDHVKDVPARLLLKNFAGDYGRQDAAMSIVGENDAGRPSKASVERCEREAAASVRNVLEADARCDDAASKVFNKLPEVVRAKAQLQEDFNQRVKSEPTIAVGGFGPQDDGNGSFSVAIGMHTDERFELVAGYRVYRATGRLEVFGQFADEPRVEATELRRVQAACKE
jgi:hypothetical protein